MPTKSDPVEILRVALARALEHRERRNYRVGHDDPDDDDSYSVYRRMPDGSQCILCGKDWGLYEDDANLIAAVYNHLGVVLDEVDRLRAVTG